MAQVAAVELAEQGVTANVVVPALEPDTQAVEAVVAFLLSDDARGVTGAVIAVGTIAVLQLVVSYSSWRFRWARSFLSGDPIVLVQDGEVIERNIKRERITHEELAEQARGQQIASLGDVQWAVFEPSGSISFIPKKQ